MRWNLLIFTNDTGVTMKKVKSKLDITEERTVISVVDAISLVYDIFWNLGCSEKAARIVSEHLVDSNLCGVESHGIMRTLQYADQFKKNYMVARGEPILRATSKGMYEVDGQKGIGIPAMKLAFEHGANLAKDRGFSVIAIRNVGHTGRHGAYAERSASAGFFSFLLGGGNRHSWRQVAPFGGARPMLPTNPYCIGIPGGEFGPVIVDFATSKIAGGWIYAAQSADALLPEGCIVDVNGKETRDPADYFNGGAILPAGGPKGYALALVAELLAEAVLGPVTTEANWLLMTVSIRHWCETGRMNQIAEEILREIRDCPPAEGFKKVEVPGEREREHREKSNGKIAIPKKTWNQICNLSDQLLVEVRKEK